MAFQGAAAGCDLLIFRGQDQKIAAFGSSYSVNRYPIQARVIVEISSGLQLGRQSRALVDCAFGIQFGSHVSPANKMHALTCGD